MTLLLSVIYIVWFSYRSICHFAPCFAAVSGDISYGDVRVRRARRVSLAYIAGALIYAVAWAIVLAQTLVMMYGG